MRTILSLLLIPARRTFRDGVLGFPALVAALCLAVTPSVLAQEEDEGEEEEQPAVVEADTGEIEEVVVTGSRLKRDTYTSVSPLQIITADVSREAGIISAADIVQQSSVSADQQIDVTFSGFVLDDGPGSQTANLRGLGSARTLLLVNGRRLGPAGVEGAPSSPDLSLIPDSLVQQYDLLLDGASSIYGSDAVAGVLNVILRKDFDGLVLEAFPRRPQYRGGDEDFLTVTWGKNWDRGFIGTAAEYFSNDPVVYSERPWLDGCAVHIEEDEGGRLRTRELRLLTQLGMDQGSCSYQALAGRISVPRAGSIYYTPGTSNGGWPSFSESSVSYGPFGQFGIDGDGDGRTDVNFLDYDIRAGSQDSYAQLYGPSERITAMALGEYTFEGEMNLTPFFEIAYVEYSFSSRRGEGQLFPFVPARNPYNICNPEGIGVDCGLAYGAMLTNPNFVAQFADHFVREANCFGIPQPFCTPANVLRASNFTPLGPAVTRPIVSVRGDRNEVFRYQEQFRYVAGVSGDLPMLDFGSLSDWSFEFAYTHTRSDGTARRPGIRGDRLELSLGDYSTMDIPCHNDTEEPLAFDTAAGCVPVNLFAPSLYSPLTGDFATEAERNYLFDDRDFATEYRQTIVTYYMTGTLFELPAGAVSAGFGLEYREDEITSVPDHVAREGLMWGYFADGGADGQKGISEAFGEVELPILAGQLAASELTLNLSARWTNDEYGGSAWTGSAKLAYRPIDSLLFRATGGTSFRAPNLRELFLRDQTGFLTVFDPCLVPEAAIDQLTEEYDPALDTREPHLLDNCRANGVDPTTAHNNGFNSYSVEVAAGGAFDLAEETSESITVGFSWEQPFTTAFDLTLGANFYKIEISDTIIEPSAGFIVFDCYNSETGDSSFCARITRGQVEADGTGPFITYLDRGFINRDNETARGVDFNVAFDTTFTLFDRPFELGIDVNAHRTVERSTLFLSDTGEPDFNEFQRYWAFAEYRGSTTARLDYDRWRLSWTMRYVGEGEQDPFFVDEFSDIDDSLDTGWTSDTCLGPPDDLLCRDYSYASSYRVHSLSGTYSADTWRVRAGVANLFNTAPPLVDADESPPYAKLKNTVRGMGYDLEGRTWFVGTSIRLFGGE